MKVKTSFRYLPVNKSEGIIQLLFNYGYKEINPLTNKTTYKPLSYSAQISIARKYWDDENDQVLKACPECRFYNVKLMELEESAKAVFEKLKQNGQIPKPEQLREELDIKLGRIEPKTTNENLRVYEYVEQFIEKAPNLNLKKGTITSYFGLLEKIAQYEKEKKINLTFSGLTESIYLDFMSFVKARGYYLQNKRHDYCKNTMWKLNKNFKKFLKEAEKEGISIAMNPRSENIRQSTENTDTVYNDLNELNAIYNLNLEEMGRKDLEKTRDLFILSSFSGLRYSDTKKLNEITLETVLIAGQAKEIMRIKTQKTGESVILPLFKPVKDLWIKYGGKFPNSPHNQKFNEDIKTIGKLAGIDYDVTIGKTRNGTVKNETKKKYELMVTHTGRRNCVTNLYLIGVPENTLMKITGHRKVESFRTYIRCSDVQHIGLMYEIVGNKVPELI